MSEPRAPYGTPAPANEPRRRLIWTFPAVNGGEPFEVHEYPDACSPSGYLETRWHDGRLTGASRTGKMHDEMYARHLGYSGVREALREHELAHHHVMRWLGYPHSPTLRTVALGYQGAEAAPYERRLWEEAMVLAFQRFMQSGLVDWPLLEALRTLDNLSSCAREFRGRFVRGDPDRTEWYTEPQEAA